MSSRENFKKRDIAIFHSPLCITISLIKPKDNKTLHFISSREADNPYGENTYYIVNKNNKATNNNDKNKYSKFPKSSVNSFYNDNKFGVDILDQMTSYGTVWGQGRVTDG